MAQGGRSHPEVRMQFDAVHSQGHRDQGEVVNRVAAKNLQLARHRRSQKRIIHRARFGVFHAHQHLEISQERDHLQAPDDRPDSLHRDAPEALHRFVAASGVIVNPAPGHAVQKALVELQDVPQVAPNTVGDQVLRRIGKSPVIDLFQQVERLAQPDKVGVDQNRLPPRQIPPCFVFESYCGHFVIKIPRTRGFIPAGSARNKRRMVWHYRCDPMPSVIVETVAPPSPASPKPGMWNALQNHWPEYLMEAGELGLFMVSACAFATLLGHPASPIYQAIESDFLRRAMGGVAMGLTAIGLICSPWGRRSGAHLNPAVTLSFALLGKIQPWDAAFYAAAQLLGGMAGVAISDVLIGLPLREAVVNYAVTLPGPGGPVLAFWAELLISFLMLATVLFVSNSRRLTRWTPFVAGALVAAFITFEGPFSGMSMNPARTWGSALAAQEWTALWVYFTAPVAGMLAAGQVYRRTRGAHRVFCAKLHHHNNEPCIFRCNYPALLTEENPHGRQ